MDQFAFEARSSGFSIKSLTSHIHATKAGFSSTYRVGTDGRQVSNVSNSETGPRYALSSSRYH